jgi:NAD(P)H-quinone oxidoreductase subunit 5
MAELLTFCIFLPGAILVSFGLVPPHLVNRNTAVIRRLVTGLAATQFVIASAMLVALGFGLIPTVTTEFISPPFAIGVLYDGVAALMLALVSFVGWVICRYSIRYLDGESTQGRYFRWTGFTIGAVSLLVISGNLLMFVVFWVMTSLGLHQLLTHYGDRPAAQRAAWTKFTISRLGDAALVGAIALLYSQFKTLNFAELFAAADSAGTVTPAMHAAGFLLIIGAIAKSAQFPFHTWLPLTMETPTPVSALMHAGIVNAGGYLIIRTSPLLTLTPTALTVLAIIGGLTACFGAVVMLTQTSVKKSLAYSTIAQMGFMMLQCGLGAFSAAMLHILAHSLYKAHAFLSSGSVVSERAANLGSAQAGRAVNWTKLLMAASVIVAFLTASMWILQVDVMTKPGGLLLGGILCLALTHWVGQVMRLGSNQLLIRSLATAGAMCLAYVSAFVVVDKIVASSLPTFSTPELFVSVAAIVACGFVGMFWLQSQLSAGRRSPALNRWYVHASNGFYIENILRRVFGPLAQS